MITHEGINARVAEILGFTEVGISTVTHRAKGLFDGHRVDIPDFWGSREQCEEWILEHFIDGDPRDADRFMDAVLTIVTDGTSKAYNTQSLLAFLGADSTDLCKALLSLHGVTF